MKNKLKSFYYYILDCLSWLLVDEDKKKQWYETDEEQDDKELESLTPNKEQ
jgi:hypothetical protein